MPTVTCPTCGEKGKIPSNLVGARIKCKMCHTSFLVTAPATKAAAPSGAPAGPFDAAEPKRDGIHVEGLEDAAWSPTAAVAAEHDAEHHDHEHDHDESASAFTASPAEATGRKHYKILTPRDKYFDGKFDLTKLEEALNHLARDGWVVRSMATPLVQGFSGGPKEELVVLLER
jgi:hypothetical protein